MQLYAERLKMSKKPKIGGAVYILPNLLTAGNLFFGYFSIVKSMQGDFVWAGQAIFLAAIFDVLDGRVARLTKGTSEFGVQFDSLCDLVSFGLAPSFLAYQFTLAQMGRIGWIVCFIFLACGALRLARFNVQAAIVKASEDFTGLPIPMAAIMIACDIALWHELNTNSAVDTFSAWVNQVLRTWIFLPSLQSLSLLILTVAMSFLMVSNVAYRSHKSLKLAPVRPFQLLVGFITLGACAAYHPTFMGWALSLLYVSSGPLEWILGWKKATDDDEIFEVPREEELCEHPQTNEKTSSHS